MSGRERRFQKSYDGVPDGETPMSTSRLSNKSASPRRKPSAGGVSKKSSGTVRRHPSGITAEEAAAKLSLTWPPIRENKDKSTIEGSSSPRVPKVKVNGLFMNEMRNLLHSNSEIPKGNLSQIQGTKAGSRPPHGPQGQVEDSRSKDAVLDSMNLPSLQKKLGPFTAENGERKYRASRPPKWNEVETMWPGFDRKPIPNWEQYAIPPKIERKVGKKKDPSSLSTTPRSRSTGKSSSRPRAPRPRIITQCGGGCQY